MSRVVEFSYDTKQWRFVAEWSDKDADEKWSYLKTLVQDSRSFGFFRILNVVEEVPKPEKNK